MNGILPNFDPKYYTVLLFILLFILFLSISNQFDGWATLRRSPCVSTQI